MDLCGSILCASAGKPGVCPEDPASAWKITLVHPKRQAYAGKGFIFPFCDCAFVSKEIGSEQIPKSTIAALGKMPGSEGNHGQTAKHRQYCAFVTLYVALHCM